MDFFEQLLVSPFNLVAMIIAAIPVVLGVAFIAINPRLFRLVLKNLRRNMLRTVLTCLATIVLVLMVTLIWTVVYFLDQVTTERAKDIKLIVTERHSLPSQMPNSHGNYLNPRRSECVLRDDSGKPLLGPDDFMTWSFYVGSLDKAKVTMQNLIFFFVMDADAVKPMMDDLGDLDDELIRKLKERPENVLVGRERLEMMDKRVGDTIIVQGINQYVNLDLQVKIVGMLPEGRYNQSSIMNTSYYNNSLDDYARKNRAPHVLEPYRMNLIWLRVPDRPTFEKVADIVDKSPVFKTREVKCETASSGIGAFLDAYRDLLWGVKWLLVPAILATMALVVSNSISISVRERRAEMAVMKVLGYRPRQILALVLGESLLVSGVAGVFTGAATYLFTLGIGGIKFPIAFFPAFFVPAWAIVWGLAMGFGTAFIGSFLPAWSARSVKVSDVFAKVA
jgi:putative ABC transport system permease protein